MLRLKKCCPFHCFLSSSTDANRLVFVVLAHASHSNVIAVLSTNVMYMVTCLHCLYVPWYDAKLFPAGFISCSDHCVSHAHGGKANMASVRRAIKKGNCRRKDAC